MIFNLAGSRGLVGNLYILIGHSDAAWLWAKGLGRRHWCAGALISNNLLLALAATNQSGITVVDEDLAPHRAALLLGLAGRNLDRLACQWPWTTIVSYCIHGIH